MLNLMGELDRGLFDWEVVEYRQACQQRAEIHGWRAAEGDAPQILQRVVQHVSRNTHAVGDEFSDEIVGVAVEEIPLVPVGYDQRLALRVIGRVQPHATGGDVRRGVLEALRQWSA